MRTLGKLQQTSHYLQDNIDKLEIWKIEVNEPKCTQITSTLRKGSCLVTKKNNQEISQYSKVKYPDIHLDRRLTWRSQIDSLLSAERNSKIFLIVLH